MEADLKYILRNLQNTCGEDFFRKIVVSFSSVIKSEYVFIARINTTNRISSIIAISAYGELVDNFMYHLDDTPCSNVAEDSICCYPSNVTTLFPKDKLLIDMGIEGYLGVPLHDSTGVLIGLIAVLTTEPIKEQEKVITLFEIFSGRIAAEMERIEQNEKLVQSEMRLQYAISGSNDGLWDWNLETNEVYFSPRWFEMLGYKPDAFPQRFETWESLVHPDDLKKTIELITEYINGKGDGFETEFRMLHKDGIAVVDMQGNFKKVNQAYCDLSGYEEGELLQKSCIEMSVKEDISRSIKALEIALEKGYLENFEKSCYKKDGTKVTINMSSALMPDKKHFLLTTKDVTLDKEQRLAMKENISQLEQTKKELEAAKEKEEKANKAKSEFLTNMSHEIRTPMTGIIGFVEQLAKGEKDPQRIQQFEIVNHSSNQLLSIINAILDFSKIESGKLDIEHHPYRPKEILENTVDIFSQLAKQKNIQIKLDIDLDVPKTLLGDKVRIKQVIFNLVSNAIKFSSKGTKILIKSFYDVNEKKIQYSVEDKGIGIAKDKLKKVFEIFAQEDASTTRKYGGTGLGLAISSKLVELMGGKLKVQSELGKGSEFFFSIDAQLPEKISEENSFRSNQDTKKSFKGHILIVEDNKTNQMLMGLILEELGVSYDLANDGVEALDKFKYNQYDMIMMDENMPNMNGIVATQHIREVEKVDKLNPTIITAVTANVLEDAYKYFLDAGMDDYISKPYDEEGIRKILEKYL